MTEMNSIWLEPSPGSDPDGGRMWAPNDVWGEGVEYVLASSSQSAIAEREKRIAELEAQLAEADVLIEAQQHDFAQNNIRNAENAHRATAIEAQISQLEDMLAETYESMADETAELKVRNGELEAENARHLAEIDRKSSMPGDYRYWEARYRDAEALLKEARDKALEEAAAYCEKTVMAQPYGKTRAVYSGYVPDEWTDEHHQAGGTHAGLGYAAAIRNLKEKP